MDLKDLVAALRKHTDVRGFEVEVHIEPKVTKTWVKIGIPEQMKPRIETFIREYRIEGATWEAVGWHDITKSVWHRVRFMITY